MNIIFECLFIVLTEELELEEEDIRDINHKTNPANKISTDFTSN